ncbi:MAG: DUF1573 domain-containing protein [Prevotellaceae bacterium]|jgi:hypothetical protein|nr:DUF1573 domain-containing protein [Prevotellaceae bacterium]
MTPILLYITQVNLAIALLCGFYILLLRKDTFFTCRRMYLISTPFVAAILPLCRFGAMIPAGKPLIIPFVHPEGDINVSGTSSLSFTDMLEILIFTGAALMLVRLLFRLCSLLYLHKQAKKQTITGQRVMLVERKTCPFSFFGWIFVNPHLHTSDDIREILVHENVHARQMHSIDILLYEIVAALCWYNPFVMILRRETRRNIEFIADRETLKAGSDRQHYQYSLLKANMIHGYSVISNNFNFNHLKIRIVMMNKKQSKKVKMLKYALAIPLICGMSLLVSAQEQPNERKTPASTSSKGKTSDSLSVEQKNGITLDKDVHDFGTIRESDGDVSTVFTFGNFGTMPLIISDVKASCGCTVPEWTKEPVEAGGKAYVKATYKAKGRPGKFDRTLTVNCNVGGSNPLTFTMHIKGNVVD